MSAVLTPMVLLHLAILLGLVRLWRKQKEGRRRLVWVAVPFVLLTLLHSPPAAYLALRSLEGRYPPSDRVPPDAGAIVVLSGAVSAPDRTRTRPELGGNTLHRCLQAAVLHRVAPDRPVLVSGGPVDYGGGLTAAAVMREFLIGHGVNAANIITEDRSRNTYENAVGSCRILRDRGIRRIVLVTDAAHMRRAEACFRAQGVDVVPSACGHIATDYALDWRDVLPDVKSAAQVDQAWHEWLGITGYWVRGRL
jgi:uncharacterized SAM-binding protein YcdF (DUF218 family)